MFINDNRKVIEKNSFISINCGVLFVDDASKQCYLQFFIEFEGHAWFVSQSKSKRIIRLLIVCVCAEINNQWLIDDYLKLLIFYEVRFGAKFKKRAIDGITQPIWSSTDFEYLKFAFW